MPSIEKQLAEALAEIRRLHEIIGKLQGAINARTGEPLDFATYDGLTADEVAQTKSELVRDLERATSKERG